MFIPDAIEGLAVLELWAILYLCHNPDIQTNCQVEVGIILYSLIKKSYFLTHKKNRQLKEISNLGGGLFVHSSCVCLFVVVVVVLAFWPF